ncbi:MAG: Asp-tRNA(Asn)/Glu-tRNA(Gln) amidotransferase subunit GatA [Bacteroidota bacterium]
MQGRTLQQIQSALRADELSLKEIVQYYLQRIEQTRDLNIYVETWGDEAIERAESLQSKINNHTEDFPRLLGAVISIKDVICYKNHKVTAASKILSGFTSQFTATAVQKALDEGAIIIGRTNCDEFAMGSTNEHSAYGPTRHGSHPDHVPGGSSGAAAVSVQMDTCLIALGSDTGGSVRQPAAYCGVYGLKPTYGRISRYGLIAYGSSFDQIGILAKSAADISQTLAVVQGYDALDATSSDRSLYQHQLNPPSTTHLRIAYLEEVMNHPGLDQGIRESTRSVMGSLRLQGHHVEAVSFDLLDYLVPTYYVLTTAEASSNLSRYDGIRYGNRTDLATDIDTLYTKTRSEGFGLEAKRRIMMGTFVLSVGYFDAYFTKAQQVRRLIIDKVDQILSSYDVIVTPTTTTVAPELGASVQDPVAMYLSDVFTVIANLCGLPALSMPLAVEGTDLTSGIQFMSSAFRENILFNLQGYVAASGVNP